MRNRVFLLAAFFALLTVHANRVFAQPAWTVDLLDKEANKPAKYDDRQLGSEKSADKKFTRFRHFVQNTIVHFNYYYDANNRVNLVIEEATLANHDDYSQLLSFYPYSLSNTIAYKKDLDSTIQKCTAAILLHDLRNDWVDNMYLLLGKAYFLRGNLDTAEGVFQFINYNLFPRKKDEDDDRVIGGNEDAKNGTLSIANKEHQNFLQKIASQPPSRNDALVWLARTLVEEDNYGDAAGLINTLQGDPNLPLRLQDDVQEVNAYLFYKQHIYDSAATHLERSLTNAINKSDLARREFLLAQIYEMYHDFDKATFYYHQAAKHTVDPLMDIYAQVNNAKMLKSADPKQLDISIDNLLKMAKKDKFETYRPLLYYSAGQLAMQKPDTAEAINYYSKALSDSTTDVTLMNKSLLALGDIAFNQRNYRKAYKEYDSLGTGDTTINARLDEIHARRNLLEKIVQKENIIDKEDSLQQIAAMPPAQRDVFIKRLSKKLNKEQNATDDNADFGQTGIDFGNTNQTPDIFAAPSTGEWYFYNTTLRSQGINDFKIKWGTRPNVDNWNRKSALDASKSIIDNPNLNTSPGSTYLSPDDSTTKDTSSVTIVQPKDASYVGLMSGLPLTPERLAASNELVYENSYELAKLFQDEMQDYEQAIETYQHSLARYPDSLHNGDIYLGLYFCYSKIGDTEKAAYYKNLLITKFADTHAGKAVINPAMLNIDKVDTAATARYKDIYDLFIEGRFDEAMDQEKQADSIYGQSYWSPQLLYIEAVYYIKVCGDDTSASKILRDIMTDFPNSPMKAKAGRLLNVLSRRPEIEFYLTNLKITRAKDSEIVSTPRVYTGPKQGAIVVKPVTKDSTVSTAATPVLIPIPVKARDSSSTVPDSFSISTAAAYNVIMIMEKVDHSYATEARNAVASYNDENFYGQNILAVNDTLDATHSLVVISSFKNADDAMNYYSKIKKGSPEYLSWLPSNKYSFMIITANDLNVLKKNKDIAGYRKHLNLQYPGKF
jgi:tetratricopeptide (TPR) repeat protein